MMDYDALYIQLMKSLKEKMRRGEYQVGDRLDSERDMASQYGINRLTVRRALKSLEEEGYLVARRGSGTFVAKLPAAAARIEQGTAADFSLSMQIRLAGYEPSRDVLSIRRIPADAAMKERFPQSPEVFEIVRLARVNGEPYAVQQTYIPADVFWDVERYDLAGGSLYEYMDTKGRYPLRVESLLKIAHAPARYAELLGLPAKKMVYFLEYRGYDTENRQIEYTLSYHSPQHTRFTYVVRKNPKAEPSPDLLMGVKNEA